ncbi:MAG: glucosaminidase domain-containing protein, partial [Eubacteriales bacterium]
MSNFSKNIAEYAQLYAPEFEIQVVSPIVAQAILETGNGVDANAQVKVANHNVFGIKYNHKDPDRVSSHSHFFADGGWEVVDGIREELDPNTSYWYGFADIEQCIIGYFEFIQKSWYTPLKECTTALEYCHAIKECGYATDPDYTTKLLSIIERYELSQYDVKTESEEHEMSNETVNIKETNLSFSTLTTRTATTRIFLHHAAATTCG